MVSFILRIKGSSDCFSSKLWLSSSSVFWRQTPAAACPKHLKKKHYRKKHEGISMGWFLFSRYTVVLTNPVVKTQLILLVLIPASCQFSRYCQLLHVWYIRWYKIVKRRQTAVYESWKSGIPLNYSFCWKRSKFVEAKQVFLLFFICVIQ